MKQAIKMPFKQGILDGLCGFYAIINALYYINPKMTSKKAEKLLRNMIKTKPNSFHKMFLDGTYYEDLIGLLKHVVNYERGYADITFETPFEDDVFEDPYEYMACLNERIDSPNKVSIISIGYPWHHWSVAIKTDLKRQKLCLFDSYYGFKQMNELDFDDLTVKSYINKQQRQSKKTVYQLYPYETIIISKK